MYHIFSKLFNSQDLWPHLTWRHLTPFLSKVVRLLVRVFKVKISLNFNKICFIPYSTTLSIKNRPPEEEKKPKAVKDRGWGSRVGMTAVKDSMSFFLKASLTSRWKLDWNCCIDIKIFDYIGNRTMPYNIEIQESVMQSFLFPYLSAFLKWLSKCKYIIFTIEPC